MKPCCKICKDQGPGHRCIGCGCFLEIKPPIYPVEVIGVACRALEAVNGTHGSAVVGMLNDIQETALRIIRDGLASHEKAIKGES